MGKSQIYAKILGRFHFYAIDLSKSKIYENKITYISKTANLCKAFRLSVVGETQKISDLCINVAIFQIYSQKFKG